MGKQVDAVAQHGAALCLERAPEPHAGRRVFRRKGQNEERPSRYALHVANATHWLQYLQVDLLGRARPSFGGLRRRSGTAAICRSDGRVGGRSAGRGGGRIGASDIASGFGMAAYARVHPPCARTPVCARPATVGDPREHSTDGASNAMQGPWLPHAAARRRVADHASVAARPRTEALASRRAFPCTIGPR
ncbi:chromate resistance B domain protein [Burkholderia thailandensis]|uniref:Chromate resistance B domain protein n=1 Tax=Burkholderia thailandensis TaxID=57975 RepID=A0AAW9CR62_BURTH|nr:chromate resistance B domain protein [Burkholderia thailandensis]MDW9253155.1 chromate resistance B domain protein [Burkholderia thailandensis]